MKMARVMVYAHGDLDGVASASVYLYLLRKSQEDSDVSVNFAEPSTLGKSLGSTLPSEISGGRIAIMDIGLNKRVKGEVLEILRRVAGKAKVEWFDHHVWGEEEISEIKGAGVELYLEKDTCGAGVVARHAFGGLSQDDGLWLLVNAVCSSDLWKWEEPMAPLYYRAFGKRESKMKREMLQLFSEGVIWSDRLTEAVEEYIDLELKGYDSGLRRSKVYRFGDLTASVLVKPEGPPNSSLLAHFLMSRLSTDITAVIKADGSISLRSRGYNVNPLARCLGGGGHPLASGALLKLPFYLKILRPLLPPVHRMLLERFAVSEMAKCLDKEASKAAVH
jgi:hypothetical protein